MKAPTWADWQQWIQCPPFQGVPKRLPHIEPGSWEAAVQMRQDILYNSSLLLPSQNHGTQPSNTKGIAVRFSRYRRKEFARREFIRYAHSSSQWLVRKSFGGPKDLPKVVTYWLRSSRTMQFASTKKDIKERNTPESRIHRLLARPRDQSRFRKTGHFHRGLRG